MDSKSNEINVEERIKEIVAKVLMKDSGDIPEEDKNLIDSGVDSLDVVEICMGLETEFDIQIPDEDVEKMSTIGDMITHIKEKTSN